MHFTSFLLGVRNRSSRPILPSPVFREMIPMRLKNRVSGKTEVSKKPQCVQEMASLFSCLKQADFDETPCAKELKLYQVCAMKEEAEMKALKESLRMGTGLPGAQRLSAKQLNELFKLYPIAGARMKRPYTSTIRPPRVPYSQPEWNDR